MTRSKHTRTRFSRTKARGSRRSFSLTDRDINLLSTLLDHGVLTTEQVRALYFNSLHRARKRLRLLWQNGLITRHTRPVFLGEGSQQYAHTLSLQGHRVLLKRQPELMHSGMRRKSSVSEHAIRISDIRVAMTVAARHSPELTLSEWRNDRTLAFPVRVAQSGSAQMQHIISDGIVVFTVRGRKFGYFIEVDRGTTDHQRIRDKFIGYISLWERGLSSELGVRSFRVLFITETEQRLTNLLSVLASLESHKRRDIINMTCWSRFSLSEPQKLFTSAWQTLDQFGSIRFVSPLPSPVSTTLPTSPSNPTRARAGSRSALKADGLGR